MQEFVIAGVDVSKSTLDFFIKPQETFFTISNDLLGFKQLDKQLKKQSIPYEKLMVVLEHTGQYSMKFEKFCQRRGIRYCKIAALQIKRSLGVIRGKNDRVDAGRIAEYGWLRRESLIADAYLEAPLQDLRNLLSLRNKMVKDRSGYLARLKEMLSCGTCTASSFEAVTQKRIIQTLTISIELAEGKIKQTLRSTPAIQKTAELLVSIKGVGTIISAYMIVCTDNFKRFPNARKFNCYAGLAPFKYESGTSIRGRSRVSHLANKAAKTLLSLAASCAIRHDQELKNYYQKRVAEGKRKMSCLNIIRSKIVARMFAVIKRQSPYQELPVAA